MAAATQPVWDFKPQHHWMSSIPFSSPRNHLTSSNYALIFSPRLMCIIQIHFVFLFVDSSYMRDLGVSSSLWSLSSCAPLWGNESDYTMAIGNNSQEYRHVWLRVNIIPCWKKKSIFWSGQNFHQGIKLETHFLPYKISKGTWNAAQRLRVNLVCPLLNLWTVRAVRCLLRNTLFPNKASVWSGDSWYLNRPPQCTVHTVTACGRGGVWRKRSGGDLLRRPHGFPLLRLVALASILCSRCRKEPLNASTSTTAEMAKVPRKFTVVKVKYLS